MSVLYNKQTTAHTTHICYIECEKCAIQHPLQVKAVNSQA